MTRTKKMRMKKMDNELLFVVYVGVQGHPQYEVSGMLARIADEAHDFVGSSGKFCIVPSYDTRDIKIECINPTFISDEELRKETKNKVDRLRAEFEKNHNTNEKGNWRAHD